MKKVYQSFSRVASFMLLFVFMNFIIGCHYYKAKTIAPNRTRVKSQAGVYNWVDLTGPEQVSNILMTSSEKYVIVHQEDKLLHLKDITLNQNNNTILGTFEEVDAQYLHYIELIQDRNKARYKKVNESDVLIQIHLFLSEHPQQENNTVVIPFASVNSISVYDKAVPPFVLPTTIVLMGVVFWFLLLLNGGD